MSDVVYEPVLEGLLKRAVGARMSPALKAKLKALGVDLDQKLKGVYPKEIWQGMVDACCVELYPQLPKDEALFRLGTEMVDGYGATLFGRAMIQMARLLGPKRTLERTPQSFRAGNNFTDIKLTLKGPTSYEMWMNEVGGSAQFIRASLIATLKMAGAKEPAVEVVLGTPPTGIFHITWKE